MIRLTRAVVTARPWHALALLLLGALAIGGAVSAPVYARMARSSVAVSDVAATPVGGQLVSTRRSVVVQAFPADDSGASSAPVDPDPQLLPERAPLALTVPGFAPVYAESTSLAGGRTKADYYNADDGYEQNTILSYRSDACAHVVLVSGRCVAAPLEVMVSESTALRLRGGVGVTMQIQYTRALTGRFNTVVYLPVGEPLTLSVVGVFRAPNLTADPYWAGSGFAGLGSDTLLGLVSPDTFTVARPYIVDERYQLYPTSGALAPDRLATVRAGLTASTGRLDAIGLDVDTELPALLDQIAADQRRVALGPAVAGAPLVLLCWFVIFLAVTQTAQARRPELALLKLRGTSTVDRWWLSAAESVVPLVAGAVIGFFAGAMLVAAFGHAALAHPGPVVLGWPALSYAAVALAGALLAGVAALRRDLAAPVVELMRRVTRRTAVWSSALITAVVLTLAGVAVFESRDNPSADPTGLVLLGPPLVVLAIGLLLGGLLDPVAERVGVFALRRGRLGLGLAALQIGRPRSSRRVVALLTIAVGLFVFAVTTQDVSGRVRDQQARITLGADRVLTVDTTDAGKLLTAVRQVDPAGAYAMAVEVEPGDATGSALLAVDSTRLATVAYWAGDGTAASAAQQVRPVLAAPVEVRGRDLLIEATFTPSADPSSPVAGSQASLTGIFDPLGGGDPVLSTEAQLLPGTHTYRLEMPCLDGCRLEALNPRIVLNSAESQPTLVLNQARTGDGGTTLITAEQFSRWQDDSKGEFNVSPDGTGLKVVAQASNGRDLAYVRPPDQTVELPVVSPRDVNVRTLSSDNGNFFTKPVGTSSTLPGLGATGGLGDLEVAIRDGVLLRDATAQVWLNAHAPPDIVARLGKAGLGVLGDRTVGQVVADAGQRPSALGWRFFVVLGGLALLLGIAGLLLASTVERRGRAYAVGAMRVQGLPWRTAQAVGLIGYLTIVGCGLVFGAGAALIAWWLDGAYLPIVEGRPLGQSLPGWPGVTTIGWWLAAAAVLVVVAVGITAALARSMRRRESGGVS